MADFSLDELKKITAQLSANLENRESFENSQLLQLLDALVEDKVDIERKLECLRALRVSVAGVEKNADLVLQFLSFRIQELVAQLAGDWTQPLGVRILLQLVANVINQSTSLQEDLKEKLLTISELIFEKSRDRKTRNTLSCILLRLMKCSTDLNIFTSFLPVWIQILKEEEGEDDFVLLCAKHLLLHCPELQVHKELKHDLLRLILDLEVVPELPTTALVTLVNEFTYLTDTILTTSLGSVEALQPGEIMSLLEIIVLASDSGHKTTLQELKSLLINALYLLRMVHEAGKNGVKDFKPIGKLSELTALQQSSGVVESSPVFGFKVQLLRLLVNLVWGHTENKSLVGELEGVQLVLDCSQIDANNPLITQWVIMAVKALCEDHEGNQGILLGLRQEGAADASLLAELGIKLPPGHKIQS